ncbi:MAG: hypothetical protein RH917_03460 [Lacipirellulaceae bacterium]
MAEPKTQDDKDRDKPSRSLLQLVLSACLVMAWLVFLAWVAYA